MDYTQQFLMHMESVFAHPQAHAQRMRQSEYWALCKSRGLLYVIETSQAVFPEFEILARGTRRQMLQKMTILDAIFERE